MKSVWIFVLILSISLFACDITSELPTTPTQAEIIGSVTIYCPDFYIINYVDNYHCQDEETLILQIAISTNDPMYDAVVHLYEGYETYEYLGTWHGEINDNIAYFAIDITEQMNEGKDISWIATVFEEAESCTDDITEFQYVDLPQCCDSGGGGKVKPGQQ